MPLFFAISGITAKLSLPKMNDMTSQKLFKGLYHKFMRIELPNLFWGLIIPLLLLNNWNIKDADFSVNPFWFLQTLFEIFVFHHFAVFVYQHLRSKPYYKKLRVLAVGVIIVLVVFSFFRNIGLLRLLYYGAFYLGFFMNDIDNCTSWAEKLAKKGIPAILFLFFACRFHYEAGEAGHTVDGLWLKYVTSFFAFWTTYYLFRALSNNGGYIYRSFVLFGQSSLAIYVLHYGLVNTNWEQNICCSIEIQIVFLFICAIFICFICCGLRLLLKRINGLSLLLFGE